MQIDVEETPCVGGQGPARQPARIAVVVNVSIEIEVGEVSQSDRAAAGQRISMATQQAPYEYNMICIEGQM